MRCCTGSLLLLLWLWRLLGRDGHSVSTERAFEKVEQAFSMRARLWSAFLPAALFACHASHVDAVAGIVGRADILAAIFGLIALLLQTQLRSAKTGFYRFACHAGIAFFFLFALLCHELAVLLLVFAVAVDLRQSLRGWLQTRLSTTLVWLTVFGGYLAMRQLLMGRIVGPVPDVLNNPAAAAGAAERLRLGFSLVEQSVSLWLAPLNLSAEYGYGAISIPRSLFEPHVLIGLFLLLCFSASSWMMRGRNALIAAGSLALLASLVLLSNTVVLMPTAFAERLLYLPSVGWALILCGVLLWSERFIRYRYLARAIVALLIAGNLALAVSHSRAWKDDVTLFTASVASRPNSARAQLNLGLALNKARRHRAAITPLSRALAIMPTLAVAASELAIAYDLTGQPAAAARVFARAYEQAKRDRRLVRNYFIFLRRHRKHATAKTLLAAHPWLAK
jgi:hypothetical protein